MSSCEITKNNMLHIFQFLALDVHEVAIVEPDPLDQLGVVGDPALVPACGKIACKALHNAELHTKHYIILNCILSTT